MNPTSRPPHWACPEWGPEHNWHECPDCLDAYELLIERAQGEWDEETVEHEAAAASQG
jgi:hypothetical protein